MAKTTTKPQTKANGTERMLEPLERIWVKGLLQLKFVLCQPVNPLEFLCRQIGLEPSELTEKSTDLLSAWLASKDWRDDK